ncbi:MAG: hypothetical protein AB1896_22930, partial [Thermodesulfobacteriota bacterium]
VGGRPPQAICMIDIETAFDRLEIRCPRLGGTVPFNYCRKVAEGLPCAKSLICWELMFPVAEYMTRILNQEEWIRSFERPSPGRLDQILKAAYSANRPNKK